MVMSAALGRSLLDNASMLVECILDSASVLLITTCLDVGGAQRYVIGPPAYTQEGFRRCREWP